MAKNEIQILKKFYEIREHEKLINELFKQGQIRGTDHFSTGHEGVAIAVLEEARKEDIVTCGHRVHHIAIAKGLSTKGILAEMLGLEEGYNKGRAGIMHISSLKDSFYGSNGIVAAALPISAGIAFGLKAKKKKNIVITFLGDGATTQGVFHEALNIASIYSLPVLFVCENNLFSQSTPIEKHSAVTNIAKKVKEAYNIESIRCDGTDLNKVRKAAKAAIAKVRKGRPFFLEAIVYRSCGHSTKDPDMSYMDKKYVENSKKKDPVYVYEKYLLKKKIANKEEMEKIGSEIEERLRMEAEELLRKVKK